MLADSFMRKNRAKGREEALAAVERVVGNRPDWTPEEVQRVIDEAREIIRRNGRDS